MKKSVLLVSLFFIINGIQGQCFDPNNQNILIKGSVVIPGDVLVAKYFSFIEEYAIVQDTITKKFGFINKHGDIVIPCIYQHVKDFYEGLASVFDTNKNKYGYINKNNQVIIPFIYDWASSFGYDLYGYLGFKGLAFVNIGILNEEKGRMFPTGKWGLINRNGEEILPVKYGYISDVIENMAYIIDGGRYDFPRSPDGSRIWEVRGKMGFINCEGKIVIPPEYDINTAAHFEHGTVTLKKNGIDYMFNLKGEIINK